MKISERRVGLPLDHPFLDITSRNAYTELTQHGRTLASYDSAEVDDFLKLHPDLGVGYRRFKLTQGPGMDLHCLKSWDFTSLHNWAIKLLIERGHDVGNYHPADGVISVDGQFVDFPTMYQIVNQRYPTRWEEYRNRHQEYVTAQKLQS